MEGVRGKEMGRVPWDKPLLPESTLSVAGREVEVQSVLSRKSYLDGRAAASPSPPLKPAFDSGRVSLPKPLPKPLALSIASIAEQKENLKKRLNVAAPKSVATKSHFKNPVLEKSTVMAKGSRNLPTPRHDPKAVGAIVMKQPKTVPADKQVVDVVIDPIISKHLRDHQREGVKFLYECVMGYRDFDGQGAILADEMGLGKTLQTIALIWTLLKQNPIYEDPPVVKKVIIVCPVTLINNWRKEFAKWLGSMRISVFVADSPKAQITDFTKGAVYSVMIIGYEKLRSVVEDLKQGYGVDLVIADEGHRLKSQQAKSGVAIRSLDTARRVILSGTPIQNDLSEFCSMVDFVNPGILGTAKNFTKKFEAPIEKARQPGASKKDIEKGDEKSEELAEITSPFILRRTAEVLAKYLPPKTEYVVLCRPTSPQAELYRHILSSPMFQSALGSSESHLQLITVLKKVCNSPRLLRPKDVNSESEKTSLSAALVESLPPDLYRHHGSSTKLRVLDQLLHTIRTTTFEKVVLVSNFTTTLDLLSSLLSSLDLPFLRLDGSTQQKQRQEYVDKFNNTPASSVFAFLLSAKAGGLGLNLIGASRLVLFDVDWNPAIDLQAMARIHRDGQKRPCFIYRFLMAGGLDEKIWQRQVTKLGLASSVMEQGSKSGTSSFTREELRDLFTLDEGLTCQTHELLGCSCGGRGISDSAIDVELAASEDSETELLDDNSEDEDLPLLPELVQASKVDMQEQERRIRDDKSTARKKKESSKIQSLMTYSHIDTSKFGIEDDENMEALIGDDVLLNVLKDEECKVNFVFAKTSSG